MALYIKADKTLTAKEWHILLQLSTGERNIDIAEGLHRSEKTISQHIKNIERKLNIPNRVHLNKMLMSVQNQINDFQGRIDLDFMPKQLSKRVL